MVNGASFQAPWNSGAFVTIKGTNFAAAGQTRLITQGDIVSQRFPQTLGCIAVTVNGQNAPMYYVQADQINLLAPTLATVGPATVVVVANPGAANELRSDPFNLTTQQAFAPALFTFDGKSVAATSGDGTKYIASATLISDAVAAKPGDIVVLYGTGMGSTNPAFAPGEVATSSATLAAAVTVMAGGVAIPAADILYAGPSPGLISGLVQLNVRLPATLADGDVPVLISVGGAQSASGTTILVKR
jgi:uncharacterized protein (TIGR03437 family)